MSKEDNSSENIEMKNQTPKEGEDEEDNTPGNGIVTEPTGRPFLVPSYYASKATVYFSYPPEFHEEREVDGLIPVPDDQLRSFRFFMHWKRYCVLRTFLRAGFYRTKGTDWSIFVGKHFSSKHELWIQLHKYQIVNHFPGTWCLGRKDRLSRLMKKYFSMYGSDYNIYPTTYLLPGDTLPFKLYLESHLDSIWIKKPASSSCGKGITVHIGKDLMKYNTSEGEIVQQYIMNPLCLNGYKFDLRVYVLVTSFNPLCIYMYDQGLVRIATVKYVQNNYNNLYCHLTNSSINETSDDYQVQEDEEEGSKWSFEILRKYFDENGINYDGIFRQIKDVIIKTLVAAESETNFSIKKFVRQKNQCFELFGFDIMIDEAYKPWLIEVNVSPALKTATPLDVKIKDSLVCDVLHLIGPEPYDFDNQKKYPLDKKILKQYEKPERLKELEGIPHKYLYIYILYSFREMIMQGEEHYHRKGHFERIFPIPHGRTYLKYYPQRRNETIYYIEWLEKKFGVKPDPGLVSFTCRLDDDDADEEETKKDDDKKEEPSLIDFIQKRRKEMKNRKVKKVEIEDNIVIVESKNKEKEKINNDKKV